MTTLIAAAVLGSSTDTRPAHQQVQVLQNPSPSALPGMQDRLQTVANEIKSVVFMPDETPQGYELRQIETVKVPKNDKFPALGERPAVRLTFWNKTVNHTIDILQVKSASGVDARTHTKWLVYSGHFQMMLVDGDVYVPMKRDGVDLALHSTLISDESAKELLKRMEPVKPK